MNTKQMCQDFDHDHLFWPDSHLRTEALFVNTLLSDTAYCCWHGILHGMNSPRCSISSNNTSDNIMIRHAHLKQSNIIDFYRGAVKSLARPTLRCVLFYGENISFDASLLIYINSTNISLIMIINRI
jgi:hypothetical protein